MKNNVILFGAGTYGKSAYYKLKDYCNIICFADNNTDRQQEKIFDIDIVSPDRLEEIYKKEIADIIICAQSYAEMAEQLQNRGIYEYYIYLDGFLYHTGEMEIMAPVSIGKVMPYRKKSDEKNILFVQNTACIRTHKVAAIMKKKGYRVFLLYTILPPIENLKDFYEMYDGIYTVFGANDLVEFVNDSDFDFVHSSNEPDIITNLLLCTNKGIVFDVHDMISLYYEADRNQLALEYLANKNSAGVIYPTEGIRNIAVKNFGISANKTFVLGNLLLEEQIEKDRLPKISAKDGNLHCVYEGGITFNDTGDPRFFNEIWRRIAEAGVHIHFYTVDHSVNCRKLESIHENIHYEGCVSSNKLSYELSKYDVGLYVNNVTLHNKVHMEYASPNKISEYANAGLPVAVGKVNSAIEFVKKYNAGAFLDLEGDIKQQLLKISEINIPVGFLKKNNLTMDSKGEALEEFYQKAMGKKVKKK